MKIIYGLAAIPLCLINACGAEREADGLGYSCPIKEKTEQCTQASTVNIQMDDIVGAVSMGVENIIQSKEGFYQDYQYWFNQDGTYELTVIGLSPLTSDCRGFSDGAGSSQSNGTYDVSGSRIILMPSEFGDTYELIVNDLSESGDGITLSGEHFCSAKFSIYKPEV